MFWWPFIRVSDKMPTNIGIITSIIYNLNTVFSSGIDALLFYTVPKDTEEILLPSTIYFLLKICLIIVVYLILTILTGLLTTIVPIFFAIYQSKYSNFQYFLTKQYLAYQNNSSKQILEEMQDPVTSYILICYSFLADPTKNTATDIESYKTFVRTNINSTAIAKLCADCLTKIPITDDQMNQVQQYFLSLPDGMGITPGSDGYIFNFKDYIINNQVFIIQSIQIWIWMICTILFVIPIRYTFIDIEIDNPIRDLGKNVAKNAMNVKDTIQNKIEQKIGQVSTIEPGSFGNKPIQVDQD